MKRVLKIIIVLIGALVALAAIAVLAVLFFFDPNDYKTQIDAAIQRQLGREVSIQGDIGLTFYPWLGIDLGRVTIANAPGFGDQPMAAIQAAELRVRLLPLLSRDIEVGTASLRGLRLRLARDAQGRSNWQGISEHLAASQSGEPTEQPRADAGLDLSSLQIRALEIDDAAVTWRDAAAGAAYSAEHVDLETGRLVAGQPFPLEFSGRFAAPGQNMTARLELAARVAPNIAKRIYRFSDLDIDVLATGEAVPGARQKINLEGSAVLNLAEGRATLADLTLQTAGLDITGAIDARGLHDTPAYHGRIKVDTFDPRAVMQRLKIQPPATRKPGVLSSAGFAARFDASNNKIALKQIRATLDASSLKGTARVNDFARPKIGFELRLDQLDIDDYRPPGSAEQAPSKKPSDGSGGRSREQAEIDLSALETLRLDGVLSVGSLTAANIHVTDAEVAVTARDGVLTIAPLAGDLYQGSARIKARVDASGATPRYSLKGNLDGLAFAPLLKAIAGTDRVAALANINIDLSTRGKQVAAMKRALNGHFGFELRDGAFSGFNLARVIEAARRRVTGHASENDGVGAKTRTPFNHFAGAFDITDGVLSSTKNMTLATKLLSAQGSGTYDLAANALDYTIKALIPEDATGALANLAGLTVPIQLRGNLLSPDYTLDVAAALRGAAKQRLEQSKTKLRDKAREQIQKHTRDLDSDVRDRINKGLSNFFGGGADKDRGGDKTR